MVDAPNDADLLRRYARERDEVAFAEIVRRYLPLVYHAAGRQLGREAHAAQDVAQQVFTLLARKATGLCFHPSLAGWLHTATRRVANQTRRTEQRRRTREDEAFVMQQLTPEDRVDWERIRPAIDAAIAELSGRDREAVLLRFFAGLRLAEIGTRLGLSENSARMCVDRALQRLQRSLARRGITSTAAALGVAFAGHAAAAVPGGLATTVTAAALSAAPAAGASGFAAGLAFMSASKTFWVGGSLLLLALVCGVATFEFHALRAEEGRAQAMGQQLLAQRTAARQAGEQLRAAESELAGLVARAVEAERVQAASAASRAATDAVERAAANWDPVVEGRALMEKHPALRRAVIERADAITRYLYVPKLREMGLSSAQIEGFIRLKREENAIAAPFGPNGMLYALPAGEGMTSEERKSALRALLGEETVAKLDTVYRAGEARAIAFDLASKLVFSEAPITGEQAEHLQQLILANRFAVRPPGRPWTDWDAVMAQAGGVLSPPQLAALARVRATKERDAAEVRPMPDMSAQKQPKS